MVYSMARTPDQRAKKWLVPLYNNIGWTYHDQKDYAAALAMFEQALSAAAARGQREPVRVAKWAIARCLRSLGRYQEALHRQLILRDDPALDSAGDGYVFEEIGENLLALGRATEARSSFARCPASQSAGAARWRRLITAKSKSPTAASTFSDS